VPSRAVLAERIRGERRLRDQQQAFILQQRAEDRIDRAKKDEELNGVRFQLREQAATFATKDALAALEKAWDDKLDKAVAQLAASLTREIGTLNESGTEGYRESEAARKARDETTEKILSGVRTSNESTATNRRWLIALAVTVTLTILGQLLTVVLFTAHILLTGG
jgi:hypothetical protein